MIPPLLGFGFGNPWVGAEWGDAPGLVLQPVPGVAGGFDDGIAIGVQAVEEKGFLSGSAKLSSSVCQPLHLMAVTPAVRARTAGVARHVVKAS